MRDHTIPFKTTRRLLGLHMLLRVAVSVLLLLLLGQAAPAIAAAPRDYAFVVGRNSRYIQSFPINDSDRTLGKPTSTLLPEKMYPLTIGLSHDNGTAYVVMNPGVGGRSQVVVYAVNPDNGALIQKQQVPATLATGAMAISAKYVCTGHAGSSPDLLQAPFEAIFCFARHPQNGTLTLTDMFNLTTRPGGLGFNRTGDVLYATHLLRNEVGMLRLNPTTGKLSWLQPPTVSARTGPLPVKHNPKYSLVYVGNIYYNGAVRVYQSKPDGTLTALGDLQAGGNFTGALDVDSTGKFLVAANANSDNVKAFDATTGQPLDGMSVGDSPEDLTFDRYGQVLYVVSRASGTISQIKIDRVSGKLSLIGVVNMQGAAPVSIAATH